jgi:trans-aconitate 2-methyltransferase
VRVLEAMIAGEPWSRFFAGFSFPYSFCGPEQYASWLPASGLTPRRLALVPKDMRQDGTEGLAGWIRTTWLPYTERVPQPMRDAFVAEIVERYTAAHPPDPRGGIVVKMVRLEVEAGKA